MDFGEKVFRILSERKIVTYPLRTKNVFFFGKWWGEALGQVRAVSGFGRRVVQLATLWRGRALGTFGPKKANVRSFLGLRGAMVDLWGAGLAKVRGWILDGFWGWRGSQGSRCRERLGEPMRARGAKAQRATNASLIWLKFALLEKKRDRNMTLEE